jgi:hypothetical protein
VGARRRLASVYRDAGRLDDATAIDPDE